MVTDLDQPPLLLKEQVQVVESSDHWTDEPPYGILLLSSEKLSLVSEGKPLEIPLSKVREVEVFKTDGLYQRIFGNYQVRVRWSEKKKERTTPFFSSAIGLRGGQLRSSRNRRTMQVVSTLLKATGPRKK